MNRFERYTIIAAVGMAVAGVSASAGLVAWMKASVERLAAVPAAEVDEAGLELEALEFTKAHDAIQEAQERELLRTQREMIEQLEQGQEQCEACSYECPPKFIPLAAQKAAPFECHKGHG